MKIKTEHQVDGVDLSGGGSGVTAEMSTSLWAILQKCAFATQLTDSEKSAFKSAWGIDDGGYTPDTPTGKTLQSITVTWSSDSADVGTDPKTLISAVIAHYSDGSTEVVSGYTVTHSALVEGEQTVTVSYNGKTATKQITGVPAGRIDIKGDVVYTNAISKNKDYNFFERFSNISQKTYIVSVDAGKQYDIVWDLDNQYRNPLISSTNYNTAIGDASNPVWLVCTDNDMSNVPDSGRTTAHFESPVLLEQQYKQQKGDDGVYRTCCRIGFDVSGWFAFFEAESAPIHIYEV